MSALKFCSFMAWYDTVVDFGLGLGQSLFNNHLSEQSAKKQHQRQLDFWNKQNAYNNPAAQRQRFNAAGMNPAAVTGQIASSGSAQGLSSVPGNDFAKQGALNLPSYVESLRSLEEIENISAQTNSVTADVARKLLENILIENFGFSKAEAEAKSAEFDAKMKESKYNNYEQEFQAWLDNLKSDTGKKVAETSESESRTAYNNALTATEDAMRDARVAYQNSLKSNVDSQTDLNEVNKSILDLTRSQMQANYELDLALHRLDAHSRATAYQEWLDSAEVRRLWREYDEHFAKYSKSQLKHAADNAFSLNQVEGHVIDEACKLIMKGEFYKGLNMLANWNSPTGITPYGVLKDVATFANSLNNYPQSSKSSSNNDTFVVTDDW